MTLLMSSSITTTMSGVEVLLFAYYSGGFCQQSDPMSWSYLSPTGRCSAIPRRISVVPFPASGFTHVWLQ